MTKYGDFIDLLNTYRQIKMKIIILALILSLTCAYTVQANDGLTDKQTELLLDGCSYHTVDVRSACVHELT
jgi:hypothetical protein